MSIHSDIRDKLGLPRDKTISEADVIKALEQKAKGTGLNWKQSISDLLFLLRIDNNRRARLEMARNLSAPADVMKDSARMNTWLHKNVIKGIAGPPLLPTIQTTLPMTQRMTAYVLGDDQYDDAFPIEGAGGEFLGECGVAVSETVEVGPPKKVTALEIWLFDSNDIKTVTKELTSEHAYNDAAISAKLKPKGELVLAKQGEKILLETSTLQWQATVLEMEYGTGAMHPNSFFQRISLKLEGGPRSGQSPSS